MEKNQCLQRCKTYRLLLLSFLPLGIPKYFIVKSDGSSEFNEYVDWLNKTYSRHWNASDISFSRRIGYDGIDGHNGTNYYHHPHEFHNNPAQFTAQEFMKIIKSKPISTSMKKVIIPEALLAAAENATLDQKQFIRDHINIFTREVTKEDVITFYNTICPEWKSRLEKEFEFLKSSLNIIEIEFPIGDYQDINIGGYWAVRLQLKEKEGESTDGCINSGHKSSVFLANCNGNWYNEAGNEIKGFLYYRPNK